MRVVIEPMDDERETQEITEVNEDGDVVTQIALDEIEGLEVVAVTRDRRGRIVLDLQSYVTDVPA